MEQSRHSRLKLFNCLGDTRDKVNRTPIHEEYLQNGKSHAKDGLP